MAGGNGRPVQVSEGTVRLVLRRRDRGKSYQAIADELNNRGVKTAHGAPAWGASTVRGLEQSKHAALVRETLS
jgi:hypothetical protein